MAIVRGRKNHRTKIVLAGLTASAVMTATRPALLARVYAAGNSFEWEKQEDVNRLGGQYTSAARSADGSALMLSVLHGGEEGDQQESPLYISTDSGAAWENVANEADPGVQNQWTSVDVSNNGQVMAATSEWGNNFVGFSGENGKIVLSVDSGDTWDDVTPAGVTDWQSVVVSGDGTKIAAINDDEYDRVYVSENSGASWTTVSVPDVWHIKSVSISDDGDTMLVGGENVHDYDTQLYRTENNGADWSDISPNPEDGVYDVKHDLSSDGTKIVAAANSYDGEQAAKVFISDNSGDTWAEETTGDVSTSQWVDAAMSDDGTVVSVLKQDEVRISTDSGATWHAEDPGQTYEDTNTWQSIDFNSDGTDAIVAGLENAYITTGASPDPSTPSVNLVNPENSKAIQITTPDGTTITCHSAVKESGLAAQDAGYTYPLGLVDFCFDTNEESNTVTLTFVTDLTPAQAVIRKYNPTTNVYSSITGAGVTETTYEGQHALQVTYTIVDNGPLDLDPDEGEIADPVGIGVTEQAELSNTGQSSVIYLSAATLLTLVSIALIRLRKQVSTRA